MTQTAPRAPAVYDADGVTTAFNIPWAYDNAAHVMVALIDPATGEEQMQASPAITVSPAGSAVTQAVFAAAPEAPLKVVIWPFEPGRQGVSLPDLRRLPGENIERIGDQAARAREAYWQLLNRMLRRPMHEEGPIVLPAMSAWENHVAVPLPGGGWRLIDTTDLEELAERLAAIDALSEPDRLAALDAILADFAGPGTIADAAALLAVDAPGFVAKDADGSPIGRVLQAAAGLKWTNGNGAGGNAQIAFDTDEDASLTAQGGTALGIALFKASSAQDARDAIGVGAGFDPALYGVGSIPGLTAISKAELEDRQPALVTSLDGGQFFWDAVEDSAPDDWSSFASDDGGDGRWKRIEEAFAVGRVSARAFGLYEGMPSDEATLRLQKAMDEAAANGLTLTIPAWHLHLDHTIYMPDNTTLDMSPAAILEWPDDIFTPQISNLTNTSDGFGLLAAGAFDTAKRMLAINANAGDDSFEVASGAGSFSPGKRVLIGSERQYTGGGNRYGEYVYVKEVVGNVIRLYQRLQQTYLVSDDAFALPATSVKNVLVRGGELRSNVTTPGVTVQRHTALCFALAENCHVISTRAKRWRHSGFRFLAAIGSGSDRTYAEEVVETVDIGSESGLGYATMIEQASEGVTILRPYAYRCGKVFDAGSGAGGRYGGARNVTVRDGYGKDIFRQIFGTHGAVADLLVSNLRGFGRRAPNLRGHNITIDKCNLEWYAENGTNDGPITAQNEGSPGYFRMFDTRLRNWNAEGGGCLQVRGQSGFRENFTEVRIQGCDMEAFAGRVLRVVANNQINMENVFITNNRIVGESDGTAIFEAAVGADVSLSKGNISGNYAENRNGSAPAIEVIVNDGSIIGRGMVFDNNIGIGGNYGYVETDNGTGTGRIELEFGPANRFRGSVSGIRWVNGATDQFLPMGPFPALHNGQFDHWRRGASINPSSGYGNGVNTADMWAIRQPGSDQNITVSRVAGEQCRFAARVQRAAGNTSDGAINFTHHIPTEKARQMAGRRCKLVGRIKLGADCGTVSLRVQTAAAENADMANTHAPLGPGVGVTPSEAGAYKNLVDYVNIPANAQTIAIYARYGGPSPVAGANDWFEIEGVDLLPMGQPNRCQSSAPATLVECMRAVIVGTVRSIDGVRWISFPQTMRTAPSVSVSAGSADNITASGFELTHTSAADVTYTASTGRL